jgi:hypothetical protein
MENPASYFDYLRVFSKRFLWQGLLISYLLMYFRYVWSYSINIPYNDDFSALLGYVVNFKDAGLIVQLKSLLLPHNEHIIWGTRLIGLLQYAIWGKLNFQWIILLGNTLLLAELFLLFKLFKKLNINSPFYFFLVALVLINPQYSATTFWAMAIWSNILVLVLSTCTVLSLVYEKSLWLSILLAALSMFSIGSGMMVWPVGFGILWLQSRGQAALITWSICAVVFASVYFYIMAAHPTHDTFIIGNLFLFPINVLAFIGSFGALAGGVIGQSAAIVLGATLIGISIKVGLAYRKNANKEMLALLGLVLFVFLTACSIAIFRSEKGLNIIVGSRYKQYSSLALAVGLMMVFRLTRLLHWPQYQKGIVAGIVIFITFLSYFRDVGYRLSTRWITTANYHNILHNRTDLFSEGPTSEVVKAAIAGHKEGIFILPNAYDLRQKRQTAPQIFANLHSKITYHAPEKFYEKAGRYLSIVEPQLKIPTHTSEGIYLVLNYTNRYFVIPSSSQRNSISQMWHEKSYFQQGIEAETIDTMLPKTPFKVAWLEVKENSSKLLVTH